MSADKQEKRRCVTWEERPRKAASSATENGGLSSDLQTIEVSPRNGFGE
jgi:hypothetical protein